jgi:hypothetical protein
MRGCRLLAHRRCRHIASVDWSSEGLDRLDGVLDESRGSLASSGPSPGREVSDLSTKRRILVSYATDEWYASQLRLEASAQRFGFSDLRSCRRRQLVESAFYERHRAVLDQQRGGGYWLWKPYYILRALEEAEPGDTVVYADAGVAFIGDVTPLADLARQEGGVLLFAGHYEDSAGPGPNVNSRWTKRDCFVRMRADEERFHGACQADASLLLFTRNETSLDFARELLQQCQDPQILTDSPNISGHPDLEDLVAHRHDQAVLSVLAVRRDVPLHRHPSQYGNHLKAPAQRVPGEWSPLRSSRSPWPDRSEPLVDHHRGRTDRRLQGEARKGKARRGLLAAAPRPGRAVVASSLTGHRTSEASPDELETFIVVHDEQLLLDHERQGRFASLRRYRYLFVGMRSTELIGDREDVVVVRRLPDNIEEHANLLSFTAWYAIARNDLAVTRHVAILEYDVTISDAFEGRTLAALSAGHAIVGYVPSRLTDPTFLYATPWLDQSIATAYGIDVYDVVRKHLVGGGADQWTGSTNHAMATKDLADFVEWFLPLTPIFRHDPSGAAVHERAISIYCLLQGIADTLVPGVLRHQMARSHGVTHDDVQRRADEAAPLLTQTEYFERLRDADRALEQQVARADKAEQALESLLSSRSWRLTAPARLAGRVLRRAVRVQGKPRARLPRDGN